MHIKSFLLTKTHDWSYEEEWRIIEPKGPGKWAFPKELLVGVILGSKMSAEDKKYIITLVRQRESAIKIYQASINKGSYSVDINDYET